MADSIADFQEIEAKDAELARRAYEMAQHGEALGRSVREAQTRNVRLENALTTTLRAIDAMLMAAAAQCYRVAPAADIDTVQDAKGNLIFRCRHKSSHEWKLDGTVLK